MLSQVQILNKVIATKDYSLISNNNLTEDHFFNYVTEFKFIKNHYNLYGTIPDEKTFRDTFPEFEYYKVTEPDNYLIEQLIEDYTQNYLATKFNTIGKLLEQNNTAEAMKIFVESADQLQTKSGISWTNILKDTSRYDRYLEKTKDRSEYYCSTGLAELDAVLGGIDRQNENMVIAARPGLGKSYFLQLMAVAAAKQGLNVGMYSGEMSMDKVGYRIDTILGHIKNSAINRGDLFVQREYKTYIDSLNNGRYGSINVITPNEIPGDPTVGALRAFIESAKLDILFVDQYSLLEDQHGAKARFDKMANISKDIKKLQVLTGIPIIAASQMNRTKNEDKEKGKYLDTDQIAESDRISQDATTIIMLEQSKDKNTGDTLVTLNIVKARDGGLGTKLQYHANFATGDLYYIPNDQDGIATKEDFENISSSYEVTEENVF